MAYTSEIEKLEQRYRENPKGRNFAPLADAYRKAGLVDNAIELCQEGLKLHPDYISAHIVYARCLVDKKDDAGAEEVFRKVLSLDPENVLALRTLAEIAERSKHYEAAVEWLTQLLGADPMNGDAAEALARAKGKVAAAKPPEPAPTGPEPPPAPQPPPLPEPAPGIEIERASEPAPPAAETAASPPALETLDGTDFESVAGQVPMTEGLQVEEEVVVQPEDLAVEGLASTQYESVVPAPGEPDAGESDLAIDLPLIMPDDAAAHGEPAAEPAAPRGTAPQPPPPPPPPPPPAPPPPAAASPPAIPAHVLSDDDGAADRGVLSRAEPVVTETMAELYLKQGHREDALRVYHALLAQRPDDTALQRRIATLTGGGLRAGSGRSAGDFLRGVFRTPAAPSAGVDVAPPAAAAPPDVAAPVVPVEGTTLDQAFDELIGDEAPVGEPTRPAHDTISLDSVFGEPGPPAAATAPEPEPTPMASDVHVDTSGAEPEGGFSFDEFFNAPAAPPDAEAEAPKPAPTPPSSDTPAPPPADDEGDLDQFQAWLKKLKS